MPVIASRNFAPVRQPGMAAPVIKLHPGDFYVTSQDECLMTVLGSCVSVCMYDPCAGIGGMNHFILPDSQDDTVATTSRYGSYVMEVLMNALLHLGADRSQLRLKIVGGAQVIRFQRQIGEMNIAFAKHYADAEQLNVVSADIGGKRPRKVLFFPAGGRLLVKKLQQIDQDDLAAQERLLQARIKRRLNLGDIELF
ncbi:hypothetical protein WH50_20930 [Pokkaliibacter plantistimulans]|uniref:Probable chemoreceptor glutamine deamidase CheD n=1 Tax=Pokkaliibacter plantistimulans TaxID=1635171 RepID=A0ABX5LS04_9GAMM|nr:hypothetical protein [Pokkaliibacter plantistimulans]PXF29425.1 hypothetical protein WH50_20930 [Pokkaliibacter plantistimulans]